MTNATTTSMTNQSLSRKRPLRSGPPTLRKVRVIMSSLPKRMQTDCSSPARTCARGSFMDTVHKTSPQQYVMEVVKSHGIEVEIQPSLSMEGFFSDPTEEETQAYGLDVLAAVRSRDLDTLRKFHEEGRPLKCSNKFGESLLHLACRKGFYDVALFLIRECKVPVKVKDDMGRSPLHDACWTCEPNFELLELLLEECSDLLFLSDARGHTPLAYTRRDQWAEYHRFLRTHTSHILPNGLLKVPQ